MRGADTMRGWLQPHRIVLILIGLGLVWLCVTQMRWDWLPKYAPMMAEGLWRTIWLLILSSIFGMALAIPLGLAQAAGPWYLAKPAQVFCTVIRAHRCCCRSGFCITASGRCSRNIRGSGKATSGRSCGRHGPMPFWR